MILKTAYRNRTRQVTSRKAGVGRFRHGIVFVGEWKKKKWRFSTSHINAVGMKFDRD